MAGTAHAHPGATGPARRAGGAGGHRRASRPPRSRSPAGTRAGVAGLPGGSPGRWRSDPVSSAVVGLAILVGLVVTTWWLVRAGPHEVGPATDTARDCRDGRATGDRPAGRREARTGPELRRRGAGRRRRRQGTPAGHRRPRPRGAGWSTRWRRPVESGRGVDLTGLNLARPLVDGEQILVGVAPPPGLAAGRRRRLTGGPGPAGPGATSTPPRRPSWRSCPRSAR